MRKLFQAKHDTKNFFHKTYFRFIPLYHCYKPKNNMTTSIYLNKFHTKNKQFKNMNLF